MGAQPVTNYVITPHASVEMKRRGLDEAVIRLVLGAPEQRIKVRAGRDVLQSHMSAGPGATKHLVRVFVDVDRDPAEVVTVYKTSKVAKYWEAKP
jgi:hypothetical protein